MIIARVENNHYFWKMVIMVMVKMVMVIMVIMVKMVMKFILFYTTEKQKTMATPRLASQ